MLFDIAFTVCLWLLERPNWERFLPVYSMADVTKQQSNKVKPELTSHEVADDDGTPWAAVNQRPNCLHAGRTRTQVMSRTDGVHTPTCCQEVTRCHNA